MKRQLAYISETRISNADRKNNLRPNVPIVKVPSIAELYDKDVSTPKVDTVVQRFIGSLM